MGFLGNKPSGSTGNLGKYKDGAIFVKKGRIEKASYQENASIGQKGTIVDALVKLEIETGRGFAKESNILGWFKKITTSVGEVSMGIGSCFKIQELMKATGTDSEKILDQSGVDGAEIAKNAPFSEDAWRNIFSEAVPAMVGEEVIYLEFASYRKKNGKTGYDTYDLFMPVGDDKEEDKNLANKLCASFLKQVNAGWVKRFDPTLVGDHGNTSSPYSPLPSDTEAPF